MQERQWIDDEIHAKEVVEKGKPTIAYAKGAIAELSRQLKTTASSSKRAKLGMAINRWKLVIEQLEQEAA